MGKIKTIAEIEPKGDFPVVSAPYVQVGTGSSAKRLDTVLTESATLVNGKADKSYVDSELASRDTTIGNINTAVGTKANKSYVDDELAKKVDKVSGKGLSSNDYTTADKDKLSTIASGATKVIVDTALSSTSTNPVQNKVVTSAINSKADQSSFDSYKTSNNTAVAAKAEKSYVDTELAKKANTSDLTSGLAAKADKTYVDTQLSSKSDTSTVSALSSRVSTAETNIATQTARIDNIAALPSGSTSGDAELIDIRTGADGKTYTSAGAAVRTQISDVKSDLSHYIDYSTYTINQPIYENGGINNYKRVRSDTRCRLSCRIAVNSNSKVKFDKSKVKIYIFAYDGNMNGIGKSTSWETSGEITFKEKFPDAEYIDFMIANSNNSTITDTYMSSLYKYIEYQNTEFYIYEQGYISNFNNTSASNRFRTRGYFSLKYDAKLHFDSTKIKANVFIYKDKSGSETDYEGVDSTRGWNTSGLIMLNQIATGGQYARVTFAKLDDSEITTNEIDVLKNSISYENVGYYYDSATIETLNDDINTINSEIINTNSSVSNLNSALSALSTNVNCYSDYDTFPVEQPLFENGGINDNKRVRSGTRYRLSGYIKIKDDSKIVFDKLRVKFYIFAYDSNMSFIDKSTSWETSGEITFKEKFPDAEYITFMVAAFYDNVITESVINRLTKYIYLYNVEFLNYEQGYISNFNNTSASNRFRTVGYFSLKHGAILHFDPTKLKAFVFIYGDKSGSEIDYEGMDSTRGWNTTGLIKLNQIVTGGKYARVTFAKLDDSEITTNEIDVLKNSISYENVGYYYHNVVTSSTSLMVTGNVGNVPIMLDSTEASERPFAENVLYGKTAVSGDGEMMIRCTAEKNLGYRSNVLSLHHTLKNGCSATRFLRNYDMAEMGACGYQNPGDSGWYLNDCVYLAASQPLRFTDKPQPEAPPCGLVLSQEGWFNGSKRFQARFKCDSDWTMHFYTPSGTEIMRMETNGTVKANGVQINTDGTLQIGNTKLSESQLISLLALLD